MAMLYIVGSGPGSPSLLTDEARKCLELSDVIIGYSTYVDLLHGIIDGKEIISTGMMQEADRCRTALERASMGATVSLVSGGDAGIYGMAGLVFELMESEAFRRECPPERTPEVRVVPGISAIQSAAALLGAPVMHDFAVVSLSDLLTPWGVIEKRLEAAAAADFVTMLFNPRSKGRTTQIERAKALFLSCRSPDTPVGIVRDSSRAGESARVVTLSTMPCEEIDMSTLVIIGNSSTFVDRQGRMVTPRGYASKVEGKPVEEPFKPVRKNPESVMFCGTASDVGKSVITAGFCRILLRRGFSVAPFKSQNMSLNSFVTPEGGEIGRAQAMQAQACDIPPHTDMNPVLLKPNSDIGSQVIVQGKAVGNMSIAEYDAFKPAVFEKITASYRRLKEEYGFVVIEGAGSISEVNLRDRDIANIKVAVMAGCPVILVADIDRGGVFAQIVGTLELLDQTERSMVRGIVINKFRGDEQVLRPGIDFVEKRTGVPVLGVLPWSGDIFLPAEDSVILGTRAKVVGIMKGRKRINVGVIKLPRISNFTDFDPLQSESDVDLHFIETPGQIEGMDILAIPGSKSTISDLYFLMEWGLYDAIRDFRGHIAGICGGFQMLGSRISDPHGVESDIKDAEGLGLLPVETEIHLDKQTHQVIATLQPAGLLMTPDVTGELEGYEIHMGETRYTGTPRPFSRITLRGGGTVSLDDGAVSPDGRIFGTYIHGIFDNHLFREVYLNRIRQAKGMPLKRGTSLVSREDPFEKLADLMEKHLDIPRLLGICGIPLS